MRNESEDERGAWADIRTPIGIPWSGRTRYAAAMSLYQIGLMDAETLEIYRICARLDGEDPLSVLRRWHVGADWIERIEAGSRPVTGRRKP